jgi:nitroreductase
MIEELIEKNRSYRRFDQKVHISEESLREWVNLVRLCASVANRQPLKFILSHEPKKNDLIFPCLGWAGYLTDWPGPQEGERPAAYIIVLDDTELSKSCEFDAGIAAQSILLGAVSKGYGGCMLTSIKHDKLRTALNIPERYQIMLVIALGKPVETVKIEELGADGNVKYWRDSEQVHHVPKRALKDLILDL